MIFPWKSYKPGEKEIDCTFPIVVFLCDFAGQVIAVLKVDQSTKKHSIIGKYQERRTFPVAPKQIPIPTSGEKKYFLADESILQQLWYFTAFAKVGTQLSQ